MAREFTAICSNYVPFVVPSLSTSSSTTPTPTSSPSSSQGSLFEVSKYTENQVHERSGSTSWEPRGDPLHKATETENKKMKDAKKYKAIYYVNCRIGCRSSERIWSMNVILQSQSETLSLEIETLPVLLMNYQWIREKVEPGSGKHSVFSHFPKDPNCDICLKTKITRAYCRRRANAVMPRAENFGDLIAADHKVLSEESESWNNHRYAVVVQDLATQWLQSYQCKNENLSGNTEELAKVLGADQETKSHLH